MVLRLLVCFFIISCGGESLLPNGCSWVDFGQSDVDPRKFKGIDPRLEQFVVSYEVDTGNHVSGISMGIGETKDTTAIGECTTWGKKYKQITISPTFFFANEDTPLDIEQVVYHELGHCDIGRGHNDKDLGFTHCVKTRCSGRKQPESIMNSKAFNSVEIDFYKDNHGTYVEELIGDMDE